MLLLAGYRVTTAISSESLPTLIDFSDGFDCALTNWAD
jgi:hypothetical protein